MRLIDADALHRELVVEMVKCMRMSEETKGSMSERILNRLDEAPTIDAVPVVHSRWVLHKDGSGTCRNCKRRQLVIWDMDTWQRYCGDCGAKMDLEVDGE